MASSQKNVDLVIRARDETRRAIQSAKTALDGFAAAQARTAARRGLLDSQEQAARGFVAAYDEAAAATEALGRKMAAAKRPTAALKAQFDEARAAARSAKQEFLDVGTVIARSRGKAAATTGSFAAFDQSVQARVNADSARVSVNRLSEAMAQVAAYQQRKSRFAAFDQVASSANVADAAMARLARNLPAIAAAEDRVANSAMHAAAGLRAQANAGKGGGLADRIVNSAASRTQRGPLGLRPYELQNLGYQVNDLFTQISSGTPVMQALAQQGGQIAQLFPKAVVGILRMAPALGLAAAAAAPFVTAMDRVNDRADSLKQFDLLLTRSGDGANYNTQKLTALAGALAQYGGSLDDARAALTSFVGESVAPDYLERFGRTAIDLSKVLGIKVPEAAQQVTEAFTGNADAVLALDDKLHFLSESERKHMELLRESKRDAEVRTQAFAIFERRYGETADKMRGPWSQILRDFGAAWGTFVNFINFINFAKARRQIDDLIQRIQRLTALLPGANVSNLDNMRATAQRNSEEIMSLQNAHDTANGQGRGDERALATQARRLAFLRSQNSALRERIRLEAAAENRRTNPTTGADTTTAPPPVANSGSDHSGPSDAAREAERLAKAQQDFNDALIAQNHAREVDIQNLGLTARELEIVTAIEQARAKAADDHLAFEPQQAQAIRDSVGALYDAKVQQEGFNQVSQTALELATRRGEVEERSAYITRNLALEHLTIETAIGRVRADQLGQAYDLDQRTRDIAASEKIITDLTARRAELQSQLTFAGEQGDRSSVIALQTQLDAINARLLLSVNNAVAFWTSMGGPEADAALLKLQGTRSELENVGRHVAVTGAQIDDLIVQGGTNAFDQFWQAVGQGEDVFKSLGDAFRAFAADFLKQIAAMIFKQMILNALGGGDSKKGGSSGIAATIATAIRAVVKHDGGIIGDSTGRARSLPMAAFANATRYHSGGIIGLAPNERAVIAQVNEEMLTADDPRHRNNLGKAGSSRGQAPKIVNIIDPAHLASAMLSDTVGQQVFINWIRDNPRQVRSALGV